MSYILLRTLYSKQYIIKEHFLEKLYGTFNIAKHTIYIYENLNIKLNSNFMRKDK